MQHNSEVDFWSHIDSSHGTDSCWPWLPARENPQGRARFRFQGRMRDVHLISFYLKHGEWPRKFDEAPCPHLRSCCNPRHIIRREIDHKKFANDIMQQQSRLGLFTRFLRIAYPELTALDAILGDNLPIFLDEHQGQAIPVRLPPDEKNDGRTIIIQVPSREELFAVARAFDCHLTMSNALPRDQVRARTKLKKKYDCSDAEVACYNEAGTTIINALISTGGLT